MSETTPIHPKEIKIKKRTIVEDNNIGESSKMLTPKSPTKYTENGKDLVQIKNDEYYSIVNEMIPNKKGTLLGYFKKFLTNKQYFEWWSQREVMAYANKREVEDGGVEWHSK